jgi:UDP-N-acetylmuramate dehydrogenase
MAPDVRGLLARLDAEFGRDRVRRDEPLAPMTTFKVGGPADALIETRASEEIVAAVRAAAAYHVPVTVLGGGSNVLIGDGGIRGLVMRPRGGHIALESPGQVRADAAVTINGLVRWLIAHSLAGLEAWAGTPGTVGGGIHGNAHWGGRLLSEFVISVRLVSRDGTVTDAAPAEMDFGYDRSRLQRSGEILLSALLAVHSGDPAMLREEARRSLAYRKRTQPLASPSAGCIFQNPAPEITMPAGIPRSAGALVDRAGLKGVTEGRALVSPHHGNFIVNTGGATAADIRTLIERCRSEVRRQFRVDLADEIVYLGSFEPGAGGSRVHSAD